MALFGTNFDEETHKQFAVASDGLGGVSCGITQDDHTKVIRFNLEAVKLHIQKWINDPKCTGKFTGIDELQEAADSKDVNGNLLLRKGQMIFEELTVSHAEDEDETFIGWIYDTFASLLTLAKTKQSQKFAYFHVAIYVGTYLGQHYVVENGGRDRGSLCGTIMARRFKEAFSKDSRFFVCSPPKDELGKSTRYFVWQKALASIGFKYSYDMKAVSCETFATAMLGSIESRGFAPIQAAVNRGHKKDLPQLEREQKEAEHIIKLKKFREDLQRQIASVPVGIKLTLDYFMNTKDTNTDIRWLNQMVRSNTDLMMAAKDAPWFNQMVRSYEALMKAAKDGNTERCKSLLEMGLDVTSHNGQGDTPLHLAARHGHVQTCEEILKVVKGADLNQPLIQAAERGFPDLCQLLINNGADSNFKSTDGWTALMIAAGIGNTDTCKALIAAGADSNIVSTDGRTALIWAAFYGNTDSKFKSTGGKTALMIAAEEGMTDTCKALIAAGATVDAVDRGGETALMYAARKGSTNTCKALLAAGADPNIVSTDGWSALTWVAWYGHTETCKILVESGADLNIGRDTQKHTALMGAADRGYAGICQILIKAGADVDAVDEDGETLLMKAAIKGRTDICKALIAAGATVDAVHRGQTALMIAATEGSTDTCEALIAAGADPNIVSTYGWSALVFAAQSGKTETCKILVESGADPNILSTDGSSALVYAVWHGKTETCKILVESGADPNIGRGVIERTALMCAAAGGYADICEIFIKAGADVYAVDRYGETALMIATIKGRTDTCKALIAAGAYPNIVSTNGWSALVCASLYGHTETCKILVESGADPNIGRGIYKKRTALMCAAAGGYADICEILIEAGADVDDVDRDGNTALALAKKKKRDDCIKVLIKNEVK